MATDKRKRTRNIMLDEGDWLYPLVADGHKQIAPQPNPKAIKRIRQRLLAEIEEPVRNVA